MVEDPRIENPRFEEQRRLAETVIQIAVDLRLPISPPVFEVLFNHVRGMDRGLSEEVAGVLSGPPTRIEEKLCHIYDRWFGPEALQKGLSRIKKKLDNEIAEVSVHVSDSLRGNQQLSSNMRESIRSLAQQVTKDDLRSICKGVAASNKLHLASVQSMSLQLERTQFQLTEMQKELVILRKTSSTDHLTGLPNRRYLDEKLQELVSRRANFCFAMIDLDHFKSVNDRWGHSAGDNILRRLGALLRENTKGRDIATRIGGEEFGLVLPETELSGARRLCELIAGEFRDINWISQSTDEDIGMLTLSAGVTAFDSADTPASIYDRADRLLYQAKNNGRDLVISG
ncbi:GGDEF domain-containing protein [Algicella marina]|uniref:diguanylate cyclase n=1 Tax=Algicella marina TaxID=2683284 RepID=A0A6P1SW94_9RHOB|nr:GGDEF domain-containing protein [Algicella marina]QHQ33761.1 diguanylate cyclase [Algicella marina]